MFIVFIATKLYKKQIETKQFLQKLCGEDLKQALLSRIGH